MNNYISLYENQHWLPENLSKTFNVDSSNHDYNIYRKKENEYVIEVSAIGFSKKEIEITQKEKNIIVKNIKKDKTTSNIQRLTKNFEYSFLIGQNIEIEEATISNGLLTISLIKKIPEEEKFRKININ